MFDCLQNDFWLLSPWAWALVTGAFSLWCLVPRGRFVRWQMAAGGVLGVISVGLFASQLPVIGPISVAALFWVLAAVTVVSAAAMISMRSPVYCAIWFAMTLAGTSCLFLLQGAQFMAVATIVVYAGAIVVMFLFLIMLAQPEGHEYYDRISWNSPAALISSIAGGAIVLVMTITMAGFGAGRDELRSNVANLLERVTNEEGDSVWNETDIHSVRLTRTEEDEPVVALKLKRPATADEAAGEEYITELRQHLASLDVLRSSQSEAEPAYYQIDVRIASDSGTQADPHVATLGGVLFSQYLIAVEVAGTLLLIALVGAVAIVIHGREEERSRQQEPPSVDASAGGAA